jgi:Cd2+/Zn2+-exporting ATPase
MSSLTRKQKKNLYRIIISIVLFAVCMLIDVKNEYVKGLILLVPYLIAGFDVLKRAVLNIAKGQVFDENFLMALATVGAYAIGEYPEAVFVMVFYQVGELFQSIAVGKSRKSITDLMDICPEFARVKRDGEYVEVAPEDVKIGETLLVKPGEKIALDGTLLSSGGSIDTSSLTGESLPREVSTGDELISGCINLTTPIEIEVKKEYGESTVAKILELVENSSVNKAKTENFITRFAKLYTPIVVILALLTAVVPPIVLGGGFRDWIFKALSFLVVSCPCALVISVPLAFFGGIGGAGRKGILIKGSNYLEALASAETMAFDKTGTLTKGTFCVSEVISENKDELLELAAKAEAFSNHPIAISLREAYGKKIDQDEITDVCEIPGRGVKAVVSGREVLAGNLKLMSENSLEAEKISKEGTVIYVACDKKYIGAVVITDEIKASAKSAMKRLGALGIKNRVMLTGDTALSANAVAKELGLEKVFHSLLPSDKVGKLEELIASKGKDSGSVVFVGDGVNDAPVLKLADVGIAMGALGSDAAIEAADIVLMDDDLSKLPEAVKIAKKTMMIVRENIVFSLVVKIGVLVLTLLGLASMWQAVFADVGVMVIAVLNTLRTI